MLLGYVLALVSFVVSELTFTWPSVENIIESSCLSEFLFFGVRELTVLCFLDMMELSCFRLCRRILLDSTI